METNYLVVDMGTGNSRVGLVSADGTIWGIRNYENQYYKDKQYEDAQYFLPEEWEQNLLDGCKELLEEFPDHPVRAITSSGARVLSFIIKKERLIWDFRILITEAVHGWQRLKTAHSFMKRPVAG